MSSLDSSTEQTAEGGAMPNPVRVDGAAIDAQLKSLARFGAYGEIGVWRLVY
jgi:hypothetical protein